MAGSVEVISHWHHSIEEFNTSALELYRAVEEALREKEAPGVRLERVDWTEGGLLSAKREYLRISHGRFFFRSMRSAIRPRLLLFLVVGATAA